MNERARRQAERQNQAPSPRDALRAKTFKSQKDQIQNQAPSPRDALRAKTFKSQKDQIQTIIDDPETLKRKKKLITAEQLQEGYAALKRPNGELVSFQKLTDLQDSTNPAFNYILNVLNGDYKIYKSEKYGYVLCKPKENPAA